MKLKCCGCKDRFDKETMSKLPAGNFCTIDCAMAYAGRKSKKVRDKAFKVKLKEDDKKVKKRKAEFYENDTKTRKAAAKLHCHAYIRERNKDDSCICCNRQLGKNYDAGHFFESGNNSALRYDEHNIHAQSVHCNQYKGGDSGDYEKNLRNKIGDDEVERLIISKGGVVKRTAQDYKDIEIYFKNKLKELQDAEG